MLMRIIFTDLAFPFFDNIPFPYDRFLPINLNTSTARPISVPPIVNIVLPSELEVFQNTGCGGKQMDIYRVFHVKKVLQN